MTNRDINTNMKLGSTTVKVLDHSTKECLVVSHYKNYTSILHGRCKDIENIALPLNGDFKKCNKLTIGNDDSWMTVYENIVYSIELDELTRQITTLKNQYNFTIDTSSLYKSVVNNCLCDLVMKVHVGFKGMLDTFNKCRFEINVDGKVQRLEKYYPNHLKTGVHSKNFIYFVIEEKHPMLETVMDGQYIDLTTILNPEDAKYHIDDLYDALTKTHGFKDITRY